MQPIRVLCPRGPAPVGAEPIGAILSGPDFVVRECEALPQDLSSVDLVVLLARDEVSEPLRRFVDGGGGLILLDGGEPRSRGSADAVLVHAMVQAATDQWIARRLDPFQVEVSADALRRALPGEAVLVTPWQGRRAPVLTVERSGQGRIVRTALAVAASAAPSVSRVIARAARWAAGRDEAKTYRVGVIGYGGSFNMGKVHADAIRTTPGLELSAICDTDPVRAEQGQRDFPDLRTYTRVAELLAERACDLAVLVIPHNAHAPVAKQCLQAGVGVISEKPFCLSVAEADDLIATARAANLLLTVYHNRRLDADFVTIMDAVRRGLIGEVFETACGMGWLKHSGHWWRSDKAVSGGNFFDWGAHMVDWTLLLMNRRIDWVAGFFRKARWHDVTNEDHTKAIIRFEDGAMSEIFFSYLTAAPRPAWRINGTHGAIVEEKLAQGHITVWSDAARVHATPANPLVTPSDRAAAPHSSLAARDSGLLAYVPAAPESSLFEYRIHHGQAAWHHYYANLADHLIHREPLLVPAEDARRIIAVIETAEKSALSGRPMPVPGEGD